GVIKTRGSGHNGYVRRLACCVVLLVACGDGDRQAEAPDHVVALAIDPPAPRVPVGIAIGLSATATHRDGTTSAVKANASLPTSDATIATVDRGHVVGVHRGVAMISATFGGVTAAVDVVVSDAVVTSVVVTPPTFSLPAGLQHQLIATAMFSDATSHDVTSQA